MVFSSLQFIFIFMLIFFGCYYIAPDKIKNIVLLIGSLCFYFVGTIHNPEHFIFFILSIVTDFAVGIWIERYPARKKVLLTLGVMIHLISFTVLKYSGFVINEIGRINPNFNCTADIVLPIGISFYTFQGISYIVDVYRENAKAERSLLRYAVYISMFEQLIAGPIVTYGQVEKELYKRNINASSVLIGYSLMAIGLGKMLGFKLPKNFDHPYTSLTMTEFWRRWHITLGAWFREYVYISLGGNRNGKISTVRNLLIVWLFTGLWHGAGYNFVLWGIVLFLIIILEKFFIGKHLNKMPVIAHLYMLILIPITWAIFAIDDIGQLGVFFTRLFPFFGQGVWSIFRYDYIKYLNLYYPFFIVGILFSIRLPFRILKRIKSRVIIGLLLVVIFGASVYCMYRGFDDPFLYFRF